MNNISKLRKKTNKSQSVFAKDFDIPVRTLQQWEQGISDPPKYVEEFIDKSINSYTNFNYKPKVKNVYKVTIKEEYKNIEKIYPIKQRQVKELIDDIVDDNVILIKIFGSSVTNMCTINSDVDIYVELKKDKKQIHKLHNFEYDYWTNFTVDKRLKEEIDKKGVVVYGG